MLCVILSTLRLVSVIQHDAGSPDFVFTIVLIVNSGMYCRTRRHNVRMFSECKFIILSNFVIITYLLLISVCTSIIYCSNTT